MSDAKRKLLEEMAAKITAEYSVKQAGNGLILRRCARTDMAKLALKLIARRVTEEERSWFVKLCKAG